jgi:hypothetical protein
MAKPISERQLKTDNAMLIEAVVAGESFVGPGSTENDSGRISIRA